MQAPKDGDSPEYLTELRGLQERLQKRLEDPATCQDRGEPRETFVTRDSPRQAAVKGMSDAFTRGFAQALAPFRMFDLRIDSHVNADSTYYRLGEAGVRVSGLELMQAEDVEALGHAKGTALRRAHQSAVEVKLDIERSLYSQEYPADPAAQAIGDALTGGVGIVRMERVDPAEVPLQTLGFDQWYASPYARVYERHAAQLQARLEHADSMLSQVLHEMAGEASLCWEPKPAGVFDSSKAIEAVERAIKQLRSILRGV